MPRNIAPATPEFSNYTGIHPIEMGGFGASTVDGIKKNLNTIDINAEGEGAPIKLSDTGAAQGLNTITVIADFVTIDGPEYFNFDRPTKYTITSYSEFKEYSGYIKELPDLSIIITDNELFIPGSIELDEITLSLNGREIRLVRAPSGISIPKFKVSGYRDSTYDYIKVSSDGYSSDYGKALGGVNVQVSSTYDFSNIVRDVEVDSEEAIAGVVVELPKGVTYYIRVRFKDSTGRYGDWSASEALTAANLGLNIATPQLTGQGWLDGNNVSLEFETSNFFAKSGASHASTDWQFSSNSTFTAIVSSNTADTENKSRIIKDIISAPNVIYARARHNANGVVSGWSNVVSLSKDKLFDKFSYVTKENFVASKGSASPFGRAMTFHRSGNSILMYVGGYIVIYSRIEGRWIESAKHKIDYLDETTSMMYSRADKDFNYVLLTLRGRVTIVKKTENGYELLQDIYNPYNLQDSSFGTDLAISDDSKRIAISYYGGSGYPTSAFVYDFSETTGQYVFLKNIGLKKTDGTDDTFLGIGGRLSISANGKVIGITTNAATDSTGYRGIANFINIDTDQRYVAPNPFNLTGLRGWAIQSAVSEDGSIGVVIGGGYINSGVYTTACVCFYRLSGNNITLLQKVDIPTTRVSTGNINVSTATFRGYTKNLEYIILSGFIENNDTGTTFLVAKTGTSSWKYVGMITPELVTPGILHGNRPEISEDGRYIVMAGHSSNTDIVPTNIEIMERQSEKFQKVVKIIPENPVEGATFGNLLEITDDGTRVIVSDSGPVPGKTSLGNVFVYRKDATGWVKEATLTPNAYTTSVSTEANSIAISSDGVWAARGSATTDPSINGTVSSNAGTVDVFKRTNTTWTKVAELTIPATTANFYLGNYRIRFSRDGNTLFASANKSIDETSVENAGSIAVYKRNGDTWTYTTYITVGSTGTHIDFGRSFCCNNTGTKILVTSVNKTTMNPELHYFELENNEWVKKSTAVWPASNDTQSSNRLELDCDNDCSVVIFGNARYNYGSGAVSIWRRTGITWTREQSTFSIPGNYEYGYSVCITPDAKYILIRSQGFGTGYYGDTQFRTGATFIYEYVNNSWALAHRFIDHYRNQQGISGFAAKINSDCTMMFLCNRRDTSLYVSQGAFYVRS